MPGELAAGADDAKPAAELAAELEAIFVDKAYGERCISTRSLRSTRVINSQTIIFQLKDRSHYVNRLRFRCPGLRRNDGIMYETSMNRLCWLDSVTVLNSSGSGFLRGPRCGLGRFYPISADQAAFLQAAPRRNVPIESTDGRWEAVVDE